jgi:hypothetical protein
MRFQLSTTVSVFINLFVELVGIEPVPCIINPQCFHDPYQFFSSNLLQLPQRRQILKAQKGRAKSHALLLQRLTESPCGGSVNAKLIEFTSIGIKSHFRVVHSPPPQFIQSQITSTAASKYPIVVLRIRHVLCPSGMGCAIPAVMCLEKAAIAKRRSCLKCNCRAGRQVIPAGLASCIDPLQASTITRNLTLVDYQL